MGRSYSGTQLGERSAADLLLHGEARCDQVVSGAADFITPCPVSDNLCAKQKKDVNQVMRTTIRVMLADICFFCSSADPLNRAIYIYMWHGPLCSIWQRVFLFYNHPFKMLSCATKTRGERMDRGPYENHYTLTSNMLKI